MPSLWLLVLAAALRFPEEIREGDAVEYLIDQMQTRINTLEAQLTKRAEENNHLSHSY
jgi:hypothetical protein